jgi:hypothetical protein
MEYERGISRCERSRVSVSALSCDPKFWVYHQAIDTPLLWSLKTKDLEADSRRSLKNKDLLVKYL